MFKIFKKNMPQCVTNVMQPKEILVVLKKNNTLKAIIQANDMDPDYF